MPDPDSPLIQAELMPDDPDVVLVTIPDVAYLDASAGAVEIGFDLTQLPELIAALRPWLDVERELAVLRDLVGSLVDPDPCDLDHHGYCQAHGWFATEPACPMARAAELGLIPDDEEEDERA